MTHLGSDWKQIAKRNTHQERVVDAIDRLMGELYSLERFSRVKGCETVVSFYCRVARMSLIDALRDIDEHGLVATHEREEELNENEL